MNVSSTFPITKDGFVKLEKDLDKLKRSLGDISEALRHALKYGDLSENAEYQAARQQQDITQSKIMSLESYIANADVIDPTELSGDVVKFGATVTLLDEDKQAEVVYKIVGEYEADIENNLLSYSSPLGKALIHQSVGSCVETQLPKGEKVYTVKAVVFL